MLFPCGVSQLAPAVLIIMSAALGLLAPFYDSLLHL